MLKMLVLQGFVNPGMVRGEYEDIDGAIGQTNTNGRN